METRTSKVVTLSLSTPEHGPKHPVPAVATEYPAVSTPPGTVSMLSTNALSAERRIGSASEFDLAPQVDVEGHNGHIGG
jgi:hypothetical protein